MERVVDLLDEGDQRTNVRVVQSLARVVALELLDQPARVVDADVQVAVRPPQKGPGEFAQLAGRRTRRATELATARAVDEAVFEIDAHLRVGALKKPLDVAEERGVHEISGRFAAGPESRCSSESDRRFSASRAS